MTSFEAFEQVDFDIEINLEANDDVVTFIRLSGPGRESGLLVDQRSRWCGPCAMAGSRE